MVYGPLSTLERRTALMISAAVASAAVAAAVCHIIHTSFGNKLSQLSVVAVQTCVCVCAPPVPCAIQINIFVTEKFISVDQQ